MIIFDFIEQPQLCTPTTVPASGSMRLYFKTNGLFYSQDSSGAEKMLGGKGLLGYLIEKVECQDTVIKALLCKLESIDNSFIDDETLINYKY